MRSRAVTPSRSRASCEARCERDRGGRAHTSVIIGAVTEGDVHHDRASRYLEELEAAGVRALLPAPVVAEVLAGILDAGLATRVAAEFARRFVVADLDAGAAAKAAHIMRRQITAKGNRTGARQQLKVDALILGTALGAGAASLATFDAVDMSRLAGEDIAVIDLNSHALTPIQGRMLWFLDHEQLCACHRRASLVKRRGRVEAIGIRGH